MLQDSRGEWNVLCRKLEVLQDRAEPRGFEEVQLAVLQELGAPIEELFADFEPQARAAASLAQVQARILDCSCMHA